LRPISQAVLCLLLCAGSLICPSRAAAQALENDIKAAFLLNFTKFVDWPPTAFADSDSPMAICVLGKDPFGRALDEIVQGETVNARKLIVRRVSQPLAPQQCQVVFLSASEGDISKILSGLGRGVLTVGEGASFVREGGIIGFVMENRRVRFDINQSAADNAGLKMSSKLLSVARSIER
jgi:hypothetical protein